ncbi:VOC family protein [Salirhabdus salicampi]|uniref:VOC family protein n=1 Tax=Salirhabdus salicampi TaxID=476102 RepID=UPI0020C3DF71|nr:VOC family protein [Salirhabdus salicampi]MCP8615723.1 VOC family protein [Salirhabdus salicampi]
MYKGIHHVSLVAKDIDSMRHFYSEVLGFKENHDRPDFPFPGLWYDVGNTQIHIIVHAGKTDRETREIDSRDGHVAIRVENMEELIRRLDQYQIVYANKPDNQTEWHQLFVNDPNGNIIEFNCDRN